MKFDTKLEMWKDFSTIMEGHIDNYCLPQYGDFPDPLIEDLTPAQIKPALEKYAGRIGKGQRGNIEELRDALKIAHYGCYLYYATLKEQIFSDETTELGKGLRSGRLYADENDKSGSDED